MAAFKELDFTRFDVWAAVEMEGVAAVDASHCESCLAWLRSECYGIDSIDFGEGIDVAVLNMGRLFRWEEQFGYMLKTGNLDALRDGFDFGLKPGEGKALELQNADAAYLEDRDWFVGVLAIAHEYSRRQLALGARFFVVLFLDHDSPLIGKQYESMVVPAPWWSGGAQRDPFLPSSAPRL